MATVERCVGLRRLGVTADSDIPDRVADGYGLSIHLLRRALDAGVDTVITCDNGIAASEEIQYAKEQGLTVIVTDHHEVPYEEWKGEKQYLLHPADAVVDPRREDCEYPFSGLCGAAVAYKLMEALWESVGRDAEDLDDLIENVAIATVGDVMDLKEENRIFVKEGLQMLERTKNPGLKALLEYTGLAGKTSERLSYRFLSSAPVSMQAEDWIRPKDLWIFCWRIRPGRRLFWPEI